MFLSVSVSCSDYMHAAYAAEVWFWSQISPSTEPELNISFCADLVSAIRLRLVFTFLPNYCHCVEWQTRGANTHQAN